MNKSTYMRKLTKALRFAPKKIKNDILTEVEGILDDLAAQSKGFIENLGTPENLAQKYLEDTDLPPSAVRRVMFLARNIFAIVGIILFSTISLIVGLFIYFSDYREFDYRDVNTALNHPKYQHTYTLPASILTETIMLNQASLVLYTQDSLDVVLRCKAELRVEKNIDLFRNACLMFTPALPIRVNQEQSEVFLIKPKSSMDFSTKQAKIVLLEDQALDYAIDIRLNQSRADTFDSSPNAPIKLNFDLTQSSLVRYSD